MQKHNDGFESIAIATSKQWQMRSPCLMLGGHESASKCHYYIYFITEILFEGKTFMNDAYFPCKHRKLLFESGNRDRCHRRSKMAGRIGQNKFWAIIGSKTQQVDPYPMMQRCSETDRSGLARQCIHIIMTLQRERTKRRFEVARQRYTKVGLCALHTKISWPNWRGFLDLIHINAKLKLVTEI